MCDHKPLGSEAHYDYAHVEKLAWSSLGTEAVGNRDSTFGPIHLLGSVELLMVVENILDTLGDDSIAR